MSRHRSRSASPNLSNFNLRRPFPTSSTPTIRSETMSSVDAESTSSFGMISPPQGYVVSQGHPGRSAIWKYFQRIEDDKGEGTICMDIPNAVKYNVDNSHQIVLDKTVAVFIAASNCPYSIIRNEDFRTMLLTFDPHYRFPGRSRLMSFVNDAIAVMKVGIQQDMASARKINFCADIWSKKGLSSSYLGLTAHFFCPAKQSIKHVTLAVRVFPYPHTGLSACISDIRLQYRQ